MPGQNAPSTPQFDSNRNYAWKVNQRSKFSSPGIVTITHTRNVTSRKESWIFVNGWPCDVSTFLSGWSAVTSLSHTEQQQHITAAYVHYIWHRRQFEVTLWFHSRSISPHSGRGENLRQRDMQQKNQLFSFFNFYSGKQQKHPKSTTV